jgi:hypothetical protein
MRRSRLRAEHAGRDADRNRVWRCGFQDNGVGAHSGAAPENDGAQYPRSGADDAISFEHRQSFNPVRSAGATDRATGEQGGVGTESRTNRDTDWVRYEETGTTWKVRIDVGTGQHYVQVVNDPSQRAQWALPQPAGDSEQDDCPEANLDQLPGWSPTHEFGTSPEIGANIRSERAQLNLFSR